MSSLNRVLLVSTIVGGLLISFCTRSPSSDDTLARAGARLRAGDFSGASDLAARSPVSGQRSFLLAVAALRSSNPTTALENFADTEKNLPLLADYSAIFQAEALSSLKRYPEAAAKAASVAKLYPASQLIRRAEKLAADNLFLAGDYPAALKIYQSFISQYPAGNDSLDASFKSARCLEESGDKKQAAQIYHLLWLNSPASQAAKKAEERLALLEKSGVRKADYSAEDQLQRANSFYGAGEFSAAIKTLEAIDLTGQSKSFTSQVAFRSGLSFYRQKNYKQADKYLLKAVDSPLPKLSSEARFWRAKTVERLNHNDTAFSLFMALADEGKKEEYAADALMEAAGLQKGLENYTKAATIYERIGKEFPNSKFSTEAAWGGGWCRYLSGDTSNAISGFKALLKDDQQREKALYWLARSLEKKGDAAEADSYSKTLLEEYPTGFYATWHREKHGIKDQRESLAKRNAMAELPEISGYEKPRILALLGLQEEARNEINALRKKNGDKKNQLHALARLYLEMNEYGAAANVFLKGRPVKWDQENLPFWTAGYPKGYSEQISPEIKANQLSEGLVYALIRSESMFSPAVKSGAGAIGLMQLMPATAKQVSKDKNFNAKRLIEPAYNVKLGTKHLSGLIKSYSGDVVFAIAAYNAGSGAVDRWIKRFGGLQKDEFIENIPYKETRDYVKKVYGTAAIYRQLYGID